MLINLPLPLFSKEGYKGTFVLLEPVTEDYRASFQPLKNQALTTGEKPDHKPPRSLSWSSGY